MMARVDFPLRCRFELTRRKPTITAVRATERKTCRWPSSSHEHDVSRVYCDKRHMRMEAEIAVGKF